MAPILGAPYAARTGLTLKSEEMVLAQATRPLVSILTATPLW
jgi:hypothetical protein